MLKAVVKNLKSISMSQKLISTYFKPPQGKKRKQDDTENNCNSAKALKKGKESAVPVIEEDHLGYREQIIALAKENPALSANIGLSWYMALSDQFEEDYFKELGEFLRKERAKFTVYPPENKVYFWTNTVNINDVKVIILGQDPYHGPNQAHGLAFSVPKGVICPPSLKNIYKELASDISGFKIPSHGYLYGWASQGVLLLNTILTVRAGCANSHVSSKWSCFTDAVIKWIDKHLPDSVFMLWGKNAQGKMSLITKGRHLILTAPHPSPFSADRGFFGCRHFSKTNEYLYKKGKKPIDWNYLP